MKERPIIFSSEMVCAILKGEKTQTRRVIKPQPPEDMSPGEWGAKCPYGAPGDELWVKETWGVAVVPDGTTANEFLTVYKADDPKFYCGRWHPSIFMPRNRSRIQLRIVNVWVERVRDISVEDAYAEGMRNPFYGRGTVGGDFSVVNVMFQDLWNSINAKRGHSWESNPWVWVIEFERIKP